MNMPVSEDLEKAVLGCMLVEYQYAKTITRVMGPKWFYKEQNRKIFDILKIKDQAPIMADSAEPKSIDEIYGYGINILPAPKGPGSVQQGIQYVQGERMSVTKRSVNVIKEYRNYLWQTDKDGKILNVPEHHFSHSLDAIRYGMMTKYKPLDPKKEENLLFQKAMREKKRKKEKVMLRMA